MEAVEVLRRVPFLGPASAESLARLAGRSTWQQVKRGQFLFHHGDRANRLYVIVDGRIAATVTSTHGTPLLFHVAAAGEVAGQVDLLHGGNHTASAQALGASTLLAVPRRECLEILQAEPAVMLAFAKDLAVIVHTLTESMADLVFLDLERRLARMLLDEPAVDERVTLTMTQSELAARLGAARQSVNQVLAKLASRELIVLQPAGVVRIIDRVALSTFVKAPLR